MKNAILSGLFDQMADVMEILGEDPFRINSYRKVARVIGDAPTDVEVLLAEGKLAEMPGIGKSSLAKIEEFIKTGSITAYQDLMKKIPPKLLELLNIPGVGPKGVKAMYENLKITTIEQLKKPEQGARILDSLVQFVHGYEPTRKVTCALHPGNAAEGHEVPSRFIHEMDVVSYNYRTKDIKDWHRRYPDYSWISTETKAYREDTPKNRAEVDYSNNSWFAVKPPSTSLGAGPSTSLGAGFVAGQFIWAGIDYLGESRGWPDKGIRSGILTTQGFPKPYAYFTQSIYSEKPMVHIAVLDDWLVRERESVHTWQESWYGPPVSDHWTFPEKTGQTVRVLTYTNCEAVELLLNGRSLGEKKLSDSFDRVIRWEVPYESGEIIAIGKNTGRTMCRHALKTAGTAIGIELSADRNPLRADGRDVAHVTVRVTDVKGVTVPSAKNLLRFTFQGVGVFLGADNGDLSDHALYSAPEREARGGTCLVLIQSLRSRGHIRLTASAEGLKPGSVELRCR